MHLPILLSLNHIFGLLVFGPKPFLSLQTHVDHDCYPPGSQVEDQYLVGYASLMNTESKHGTHPHTGESVPIRLDGFERSWSRKGDSVSFSTTYIGVEKTLNKTSNMTTSINAVYFRIQNVAAMHFYDSRELFYCREELETNRIHLITKNSIKSGLPKGQFWIYVTKPDHRETPTEKYPITQSYVDKFIAGCLELETHHKLDGFAEECVNTTSSWDSPWINDRIFPRRPFIHQKMAGQIDILLNRTAHSAYKKIKIRG